MNENDYGNNFETKAENKPKEHKNNNGIIAIICCIIVALSITGAAVYVTYSSNKKAEETAAAQKLENATKRINELFDDIYQVESSYDSSYDLAKDKLDEAKQLIDENGITGALVTKYDSASTYIKDLKTYDEIMEYAFSDEFDDMSRVSQLTGQLKDEKILRKLEQSEITESLESGVKKILLAKWFYRAQQCVLNKYPGSAIGETYYYDQETFEYGRDVPGTDRTLTSEDDTDFDYTSSIIMATDSTINKINENGGHAIIVRYRVTSSWHTWWCVGIDVKAELNGAQLRFDIIRYSGKETYTEKGLTLDQAVDYNMTNLT